MSVTFDVTRVLRGRLFGRDESRNDLSRAPRCRLETTTVGHPGLAISACRAGSWAALANHCRLCVRQREQITVIRVKEA